jgi:hypothetical protein
MSEFSVNHDIENHPHKRVQVKNKGGVKFKTPLILQIYSRLNNLELRNENRYILCNFLDQYGDIFELKGDIYIENNKRSLNQLLLMALRKANDSNLIDELYEEYQECFKAIRQKNEISKD